MLQFLELAPGAALNSGAHHLHIADNIIGMNVAG